MPHYLNVRNQLAYCIRKSGVDEELASSIADIILRADSQLTVTTKDFSTEPIVVTKKEKWRTGRKVGRTIYCQQGPEPSDLDVLIGVMDRITDAELVVELHNGM